MKITGIHMIYRNSDSFTESTRRIPKKRCATATFQPWGRPRAEFFKNLDFTCFWGGNMKTNKF